MAAIALALCVATGAAAAERCFDFEAWRTAIVAGDAAGAGRVLEEAMAACGCRDEGDVCLQLPGDSRVVDAATVRDAAERLARWRGEVTAKCDPLPVDTDRRLQAKRDCYGQAATGYSEGLAGESDGAWLAPLPPAMVAAAIAAVPEPADPTPDETRPMMGQREYNDEVKKLGEQICALSKRLDDLRQKLDHVERRGQMGTTEKYRRMAELRRAINELSDAVAGLKREFRGKTGEMFRAYDFCGPEDEGEGSD